MSLRPLIAAALLAGSSVGTANAAPLTVVPQTVSVAQSFWAPYNQGVVPCTSVDIAYVAYPELATGEPARWGEARIGAGPAAFVGRPVQTVCNLILSDKLGAQPLAFQSMVVAHEVGHNAMGLDHSPDPGNIMYAYADEARTHIPNYFTEAFPVPAAQVAAAKAAAQAAGRCGTGLVAAQRTLCGVARRIKATFVRALNAGRAITRATVRVSRRKRVSVRYRLRGAIVTATADGGISVKFAA